jgi:hypothetical protein
MIRARRTTRLVAALALAGFLTSSPLTPTPLSATATAITISRADFCAGLGAAIAYLQAHPGRLNDFLLKVALKLQADYCTTAPA